MFVAEILGVPDAAFVAVAALVGTVASALILSIAQAARQRDELAHAEERQLAQLKHDRELADRDELRRILDDAVTTTNTLYLATANMGFAYRQYGARGGGDTSVYESPTNKFLEAHHAVSDVCARLTIRLGKDDEVTLAAGKFLTECAEKFAKLNEGAHTEGHSTDAAEAGMGETLAELRDTRGEFLVLATALAKSELRV